MNKQTEKLVLRNRLLVRLSGKRKKQAETGKQPHKVTSTDRRHSETPVVVQIGRQAGDKKQHVSQTDTHANKQTNTVTQTNIHRERGRNR